MITFKRKSAKAIIVNQSTQHVLVVRSVFHQTSTFFGLPGGGIKSGESPESSLIREVKEELGLSLNQDICTPRYLGTYTHSKMFIFFRLECTIHFYHIDIYKEFSIQPNWEISRYRWVQKEDLRDSLSHFYRKALSAFLGN